MIEDDMMKNEAMSPPEQQFKDNIVGEYLEVDSRMGRLHRFVEWSDEFAKLDKDSQDLFKERLEAYKKLSQVLYKLAVKNNLWGDISNLLQ